MEGAGQYGDMITPR